MATAQNSGSWPRNCSVREKLGGPLSPTDRETAWPGSWGSISRLRGNNVMASSWRRSHPGGNEAFRSQRAGDIGLGAGLAFLVIFRVLVDVPHVECPPALADVFHGQHPRHHGAI